MDMIETSDVLDKYTPAQTKRAQSWLEETAESDEEAAPPDQSDANAGNHIKITLENGIKKREKIHISVDINRSSKTPK